MKTINLNSKEYFDINNEIEEGTSIYNIRGGRGVGKTFSVLKFIFDNDLIPFVYCRVHSTEIRHCQGIIEEHYSAVELADKLGLVYDNTPTFVKGKPEAGSLSIRYTLDGDKFYKRVCYGVSINNAALTKGFSQSGDDKPKMLLFDEYTSFAVERLKLYKAFIDIQESLFRQREHYTFLLTNNNSKVVLFEDLYKNSMKTVQVNKKLKRNFENASIEQYLNGGVYEADTRNLNLIGYYYISRDEFCSLWSNKRGLLLCIIEDDKVKPKAKIDLNIFEYDLYFEDEYSEQLFNIACENKHKL